MITNLDNALDDAVAPGLPKRESYNPPRPIVDLTNEVYQHLTSAYNARSGLESNWSFYCNFIEGDQDFLRDNKTGGLIRMVNTDKRRLRSQNNQVKPIARSFKGKMVRPVNLFTVRPGSGSEDEIYGGRMAERYLEYWAECNDLLGNYSRVVGDILWAGHGVLQLYRDPNAGDHIASCQQCGWSSTVKKPVPPNTPCPMCQEQQAMGQTGPIGSADPQASPESQFAGQSQPTNAEGSVAPQDQANPSFPEQAPVPTLIASRSGQTKIRYLDPRMVYPQPGVTELSNMERIITRYPLPITLARRLYPHIAAYIEPESDIYPAHGARYTFNTATGRFRSEEMSDTVFVVECHTKPDSEHPRGRVIQFVNRIYAGEGEGMWDLFERFPFFFFFGDLTPGEFYPTPIMSDVWSRQNELNEHETVVRENGELASRQKIAVASEARLRADEITAATDQIIRIPAAFIKDIAPIPTPQLDPIHVERPMQLKEDMRTMIGVTSQETNNGQSDVGRVIAFQEAESDQTMSPTVQQHARELAMMGYCSLSMAAEFERPEKFFTLEGDNGLEYFSFMALNFDPGCQVMLFGDDGLSRNQAVRLQQIAAIAGLGVFGGVASMGVDINSMVKAMRLKIPGHRPDSTDPEQVAARAAIRKILDGTGYEPMPQDDPETFANAMVYWMRTQGRQLPNPMQDPRFQQIAQLQAFYAQQLLAMRQAAGKPTDPQLAQDQQNPEAQPTKPGQTSPQGGDQANVNADAESRVQAADSAGNAAANGSQRQEGPQSS